MTSVLFVGKETYMSRFLSILLLVFNLARVASAEVTVKDWPDEIYSRVLASKDWKETVSEALFKAMDDIQVFDTSITENLRIELKVSRDIYDNRDDLETWTVVDRFFLLGTLTAGSELLELGQGFLNFHIRGRKGIEFINIRQVAASAKSMGQFPTLAEIESAESIEKRFQDALKRDKEIGKFQPLSGTSQTVAPLENADDPNLKAAWAPNPIADIARSKYGKLETLEAWDSENHARFGKLWNLISFPFRFPFKTSSVTAMKTGEILGYDVDGTLELGASAGFSSPDLAKLVRAQYTLLTFIRSNFKVSVLKESNDIVRVKLSKLRASGNGYDFGSGGEPEVFDGMVLLKPLVNELDVIPLKLKVRKEYAKAFDLVYRYDLSKPKAKEAYEKAVLGQFALSDQCSGAINPDTGRFVGYEFTLNGCERLPARKTETENHYSNQQVKLTFIFKSDSSSRLTVTKATLEYPTGDEHTLEAVSENDFKWRFLWLFYEKTNYRFNINLDIDSYENDPENPFAMNMIVEGSIEDTDTYFNELMRYILECENSVGVFGVYPRILPPEKGQNLGRSRFYYRLALDRMQLDAFMRIPDEQMWGYLYQAFDVKPGKWDRYIREKRDLKIIRDYLMTPFPVLVKLFHWDDSASTKFIHAARIRAKWMKLKTMTSGSNKAETLASLFYNRVYGYELVRLIRSVLGVEASANASPDITPSVPYLTIGSTPLWGRILKRGEGLLDPNETASELQRDIDRNYNFDDPRDPRRVYTKSASVEHLEIKWVDGKLVLEFNVSNEVNLSDSMQLGIAVSLKERKNTFLFHSWKPLKTAFTYGKDLFKSGINTLVLDSRGAASPWKELAGSIKPGKSYKLLLAVSAEGGFKWGRSQEIEFKAP